MKIQNHIGKCIVGTGTCIYGAAKAMLSTSIQNATSLTETCSAPKISFPAPQSSWERANESAFPTLPGSSNFPETTASFAERTVAVLKNPFKEMCLPRNGSSNNLCFFPTDSYEPAIAATTLGGASVLPTGEEEAVSTLWSYASTAAYVGLAFATLGALYLGYRYYQAQRTAEPPPVIIPFIPSSPVPVPDFALGHSQGEVVEPKTAQEELEPKSEVEILTASGGVEPTVVEDVDAGRNEPALQQHVEEENVQSSFDQAITSLKLGTLRKAINANFLMSRVLYTRSFVEHMAYAVYNLVIRLPFSLLFIYTKEGRQEVWNRLGWVAHNLASALSSLTGIVAGAYLPKKQIAYCVSENQFSPEHLAILVAGA